MNLLESRPRLPLLGVAFAALVGIAAADRWPASLPASFAACAITLLAVLIVRRTAACLVFVATAFATLHNVRHFHSDARLLAAELAGGEKVVTATGIVWSEPEQPAYWSREVTSRFQMKLERIEIDGRTGQPGAIVNVEWAGAIPAYGDRIECRATARNIAPARNPGQLDFGAWLARRGILSELAARYPGDCRVLDGGLGSRAELFAMRARRWVCDHIELDLADAPEVATLIESMVLGLRGSTDEDDRLAFQRTGTLHLFAVSGLNVAMLATIVWCVLKPLGVGRRAAIALIIPMLAGYALVTGLSASCVRAALMASLVLMAFAVDRPVAVFNSLAGAAIAILAWDTNQLFSPGFQFSFVLVAAIIALARRFQRRCEGWTLPDPFLPRPLWGWRRRGTAWLTELIAAAIGVTLAAWIGSLVFTAGYFHLFSPAGIAANLVAVPLAFAVLALGVATLVIAPFWTAGAVWCNNANWLCAKALLLVVHAFARLPGGHVYVEAPRAIPRPSCELTVFDLGEGGAIHLRSARRDWLLDCGHENRYPRVLLPYLRSRGINRLDGLLLTHGDAQHLAAAPRIVEDFAPRSIVDSALKDRSTTRRALRHELAGKGLGKRICRRGDTITISPQTTLSVLFPPAGIVRSAADDKALVLRLVCEGRRILLMSDSGFFTEEWLLANEPDLRADLVVKGQHARDFSGTAEFLARVQPQAVICCALDFGDASHTLDEWAQDAAARGIVVFRQDQCGAAQIEIRDGAVFVRGYANGQSFRIAPR